MVYEIMHGEKIVARLNTNGECEIKNPAFLPYHLYLTKEQDMDSRMDNMINFYYWCATRVLTLDRQYAKEILNSIGVTQAVTDRDRAKISLSYHCLSLMDIYWVRQQGEEVTFQDVNLFDNHLGNAFVDVSLRGKQMTIENKELARDLSTNGCFPKAWVRTETGFQLLKDGGEHIVENEVLASRICQCFSCEQAIYRKDSYGGELVSASDIFTSKQYSIVSREQFEIFAVNQEINPLEYILKLDSYSYYMMNILDYLVGNTDRHWGNWGFLIDNATNQPVSLHPLMDFNQVFHSYDTVEGANCQTVLPERMTQKEAALHGVKQVGLNQTQEVKEEWFCHRQQEWQMFQKRLELLKQEEKGSISP